MMKHIAFVLIIMSLALFACSPQAELIVYEMPDDVDDAIIEDKPFEFEDEFVEDEFMELEAII